MNSSIRTEGLTSLISYTPQLPIAGIHAAIVQNEVHPEIHARSSQPALEVVSARQNRPPTHNSTTRLRSPPIHVSPPTELVEVRSALQRTRQLSQSETALKQSDTKKESASSGGLAQQKAIPTVHAERILNPLKKKKTVVFGRTVNVSQTVEGSKLKKKQTAIRRLMEQRCSTKELGDEELATLKRKVDELKQSVEELEKKDGEKQQQILKLEKKDIEKEQQMLQLTNMVKKLMNWTSPQRKQSEERILTGKTESSKGGNARIRRRYSGKENIPPEEGNRRELDDDKMKRLLIRKWEESDDFRRLVEEGLMKFSGDHSLDAVADVQRGSQRMQRRAESPGYEKDRHFEEDFDNQAPVLKATRVTKQMTVEQIRCMESPARSNAFSLDSRKYLARYGISGTFDDGEDGDGDRVYKSHAMPPLESMYEPGRSVTYCPSGGKYNRERNPGCTSRKTRTRPPQRGGGYEAWEERNVRGDEGRMRRHQMERARAKKLEFDEADGSSDELLNEPLDLDDDVFEPLNMQSERTANAAYRGSPLQEERPFYHAEGHRMGRRRTGRTNY